MTIKKHFSYSPFDGFNFYDIRENAVENGEWDVDDACIFWGEVSQAPFEITGERVNGYGDCETELELRNIVAKAIKAKIPLA